MSQPLVSVVTPFHNTAPYLAQCIESVLDQSYPRFEYILVDNCSTDGSDRIADAYAQRDPRIRVIRRSRLLSQVQNYNAALTEISPESEYCKMVQADDYIFPECLRSMVQRMEQFPSVGLVSSYWLKGDVVRGSGFPHDVTMLPGKEMARMYLRTGIWVFASPTTVLYRSAMVRRQVPFYDESRLHEDSEKCMRVLQDSDFGFVHQVLSFSRANNESISSAMRDFQPAAIDRYILVQRYASAFLEPGEAAFRRRESRQGYYGVLAREALRMRESDFWDYHRRGLATMGEKIDALYLARQIGRELLRMTVNPGATAAGAIRFCSRAIRPKTAKALNRCIDSPEPSLQDQTVGKE